MMTHAARLLAIAAILLLVGCNRQTDPYGYGDVIKFKDNVQTNAEVSSSDLAKLKFQDPAGKEVTLKQYHDQKNVVLVITRGYVGSASAEAQGGSFCLYCSTQAARLVVNYSDFKKRDAEVLLVFPVARSEDAAKMDQFATNVHGKPAEDMPFPLVLDLELTAVEQLGIRDDLSKPATYILDKRGNVRFAYVGQTLSDRPSLKSMLDQLDAINRRQ